MVSLVLGGLNTRVLDTKCECTLIRLNRFGDYLTPTDVDSWLLLVINEISFGFLQRKKG
jgi:hypothetical protein